MGLLASTRTTALAGALVCFAAMFFVFLCGAGGGVFRSDDGGQTWKAYNTGLGNRRVLGLAIAAYFYLRLRNETWPPNVPPPMLRWRRLSDPP